MDSSFSYADLVTRLDEDALIYLFRHFCLKILGKDDYLRLFAKFSRTVRGENIQGWVSQRMEKFNIASGAKHRFLAP